MKILDTPLIADKAKKTLSALGYKQLNRFIAKAAKANNTHRYSHDFKPMLDQVTKLVYSLIFDHNVNKYQLSQLQKSIKITNGKLELPSISTQN